MKLSMENDISYLPNDKSIFLIEEISNRHDYQLIRNKRIFTFFSLRVFS